RGLVAMRREGSVKLSLGRKCGESPTIAHLIGSSPTHVVLKYLFCQSPVELARKVSELRHSCHARHCAFYVFGRYPEQTAGPICDRLDNTLACSRLSHLAQISTPVVVLQASIDSFRYGTDDIH